jgi:hypothetical protein
MAQEIDKKPLWQKRHENKLAKDLQVIASLNSGIPYRINSKKNPIAEKLVLGAKITIYLKDGVPLELCLTSLESMPRRPGRYVLNLENEGGGRYKISEYVPEQGRGVIKRIIW